MTPDVSAATGPNKGKFDLLALSGFIMSYSWVSSYPQVLGSDFSSCVELEDLGSSAQGSSPFSPQTPGQRKP